MLNSFCPPSFSLQFLPTLFSVFQKCSLLFVFSPLAQHFPLSSLSISLFLPSQFTFGLCSVMLLLSPWRYAKLPSLCATLLQMVLSRNDCRLKFCKAQPKLKLEVGHTQINNKTLLPSPDRQTHTHQMQI